MSIDIARIETKQKGPENEVSINNLTNFQNDMEFIGRYS